MGILKIDSTEVINAIKKVIKQQSQPQKIIFNNPATIVIWQDGTKTMAKCAKGDVYDKMTGFLLCYYKHVSGVSNSQIGGLYDMFAVADTIDFSTNPPQLKTNVAKLLKEENNG